MHCHAMHRVSQLVVVMAIAHIPSVTWTLNLLTDVNKCFKVLAGKTCIYILYYLDAFCKMMGDILQIIRILRSLFLLFIFFAYRAAENYNWLNLVYFPLWNYTEKQCSLCAQYATHCIIHIAKHFNSFKTQQMEDKKDILTWICEGRE